jgi:hypothetical protein
LKTVSGGIQNGWSLIGKDSARIWRRGDVEKMTPLPTKNALKTMSGGIQNGWTPIGKDSARMWRRSDVKKMTPLPKKKRIENYVGRGPKWVDPHWGRQRADLAQEQ